ncbi:YqjF family protein [Pedococcus sp. NPDC057267]|uniref:YqjF family protein n=1 Tax=Pedococcus sp. NPDC057267 TaxID=3346077 RepID=UPI00363FB303
MTSSSVPAPAPMPAQGPPLRGRPLMSQLWRDITFVHWRVDPARLEPFLPAGVQPDVHDGAAWVGLIPFRMVDAAVGRGRPVPWLGTFLETNVRVYSRDASGRRGVVFLSLDAERLPVVAGARLVFGTPYQWAGMRSSPRVVPADPAGTEVAYSLHRHRAPWRDATRAISATHGIRASRAGRAGSGSAEGRGARSVEPAVTSSMRVRVGEPLAEPGDLELFLTARFGLHTTVARRTLWVPNTHAPWPLHRAELLALDDRCVAAAGLDGVVSHAPDSVLFSPGVETTFGWPVRV